MLKEIMNLAKQQIHDIFKQSIGKILMKLVLALVLMAGFIGGCSYLNQKVGLPDDNIIEEAVENKIEDATGLNIDLSPESPE